MPAVSVVVPTYNHAPFLERRLRSILDQTWQDFDVLVLDDASTDATPAVLERFEAHPRVRIERQPENSGSPFRQWNAGLVRTDSAFVWIAESDDEADPRFLETLVSRMQLYPRCGLAFAQSLSIDAEGHASGTLRRWTDHVDPAHWLWDYVNGGRDECARYLAVANTIPSASAVVFQRQAFVDAGGAPEHLRLAGDWLTWFRLLLGTDVAFVAEPLNRHRSHAGTVRAGLADDARWWDETLSVWQVVRESLPLPVATRRRIVDIVREVVVRLMAHPVANRRTIADLWRFGRELDPALPLSTARMVMTRAMAGARAGARPSR
ncbi:MAG: glycosyltransferase family 2 protein [Vicinamibacterales bacterium]